MTAQVGNSYSLVHVPRTCGPLLSDAARIDAAGPEGSSRVSRVGGTTAPERAALILVAEDEVILGMEIEQALADAGHRVEGPLASGAAARARLAACRPDFAILDARLDDGFCEDLARDLGRLGVPFVVCSGWSGLETSCPALGAAPRLVKPVDLANLMSVVDEGLAGRATAAEATR